jgi:succinoglycan biosynthesis transport protein ExoP
MYRLFVTIAYRKWLILLVGILVFACVAVLTFKTQPMYKATAALQLAPDTRQFLDVANTAQGLKLNDTAFYKTQYEILASETLSERVIDKLDLKIEQVARKTLFGSATGQDNAVTPERSRAELLKLFTGQLNVAPVENSEIVYVSFSAPDKELAAQVANTFADEYVHFNRESYDASIEQAKATVLEKIEGARQSLQQTENKVQQFASQKELVVTNDDTNPYLDSLIKLNQEMMLAEKERVAAEAALQKGAGDVSSTSAVLDNHFIQELKGRQAELQAEYEKNLKTFKPNYPDMVQLREQITEIDKKLAMESSSFKKNLQLNYEARKKQEAEMKRMLEKSSKQYQSYLQNMATHGQLTRDLEVEKAMYESLLKRLKDIDVASGVSLSNITVLEKASVPQFSYAPNYLVNLSMGGIIALLLGVSIAGVIDFRDGRLKSQDDLLGLPMQRSPMLEKLDRKMLTRSGAAETLLLPSRNTFANLQVGSQRGQMRIISLLALGKDDKHVAFMFNLISFFLKKKLKVILLAMDEDHAAVRKQVQIAREGELFVVDASQPILINKTDREGLSVSLLNVDELFTGLDQGEQFGSTLQSLAGRFDLVLLMSTDVGLHPEIVPALDSCDLILVNALKRKTRIDALERLVTRLERLPNTGFCILHDM